MEGNGPLGRIPLGVEEADQNRLLLDYRRRNLHASAADADQRARLGAVTRTPFHQLSEQRLVPTRSLFGYPRLIPESGMRDHGITRLLNPLQRTLSPPEAALPTPR